MGEITKVFNKITSDLCSDKENYTKTVRTALSTEVCNNMFKQGFTLDQIIKSMPCLEKSDIYGLSVIVNGTPVSATEEEIEDIKWTFRRTRKPKVLGKLFNKNRPKDVSVSTHSALTRTVARRTHTLP